MDPALVKMMATTMKDDPHHSMTPERKARLEEAAKHPDEKDLAEAKAVFADLAKRLQTRWTTDAENDGR